MQPNAWNVPRASKRNPWKSKRKVCDCGWQSLTRLVSATALTAKRAGARASHTSTNKYAHRILLVLFRIREKTIRLVLIFYCLSIYTLFFISTSSSIGNISPMKAVWIVVTSKTIVFIAAYTFCRRTATVYVKWISMYCDDYIKRSILFWWFRRLTRSHRSKWRNWSWTFWPTWRGTAYSCTSFPTVTRTKTKISRNKTANWRRAFHLRWLAVIRLSRWLARRFVADNTRGVLLMVSTHFVTIIVLKKWLISIHFSWLFQWKIRHTATSSSYDECWSRRTCKIWKIQRTTFTTRISELNAFHRYRSMRFAIAAN